MFQRSLLTDHGVEQLAEGVLAVLERVGVLCQNGEILEALAEAGAEVDRARDMARFPRGLVEPFAAGLRQEASANGAPAAFLAPPLPAIETQVAQFFYDDKTKRRRPGNKADFITLTKLGEVLHGKDGVGHSLLLTDVPPLLEPLEAGLLLAEHAHVPGGAFAWNVRQVDYLVEMGEVLGIPDWFSWGAICFAHPLRFDKDVADKLVRRVRSGAATGLTSMAIAGISTPVPTAGFVVVAAAEFIATWIAARALNPSVPLGGSMWGGTVDMRTGAISYSCPDAMLRAFAAVEFLRRWCGQAVGVGGGEYCDAREPGLYTALEKAYKAMTIAAFTGYHPTVGQGMLEEGKTITPAQLLLERELGQGDEYLGESIEITPETIALDTILDVGIGLERNYLETEHTLRHFRELWRPALIDRSGWNGRAHEEALLERARLKVEALVASYRKPEVDGSKLHALRRVVERARRELAEG